jgi:TP901 family phage tail tape measure protein
VSALNNVGIGGILTFNGGQAVSGMAAATTATGKLESKQSALSIAAAKVGGAFSGLGSMMTKGGLLLSPVTAAFGLAEKYALDFEKAMSGVKAVAGASAGEMAQLTLAAKKFGAKSTFDPVEVAGAMEELARAGFNTTETLSALPGVLAAAAAEGMPLAEATSVITSTLRGMGLEADQSARVADVLALASAKTNASISSLGEGMKYAAAQSKAMGIDLETTVGLLGLASDAGLQGSIAGSSFAAMLTKLSKPSKEAAHWLKANNIEMKKTADGGLDIIAVVKEINTALEKEGDVMKKGAVLAEVFGDRGKKMFGALTTGIDSGKIDTIVADLQKAAGSAEKMANTRLEGILGTLKQIYNAGKALMLEFFGGLIQRAGPGLKQIGTAFGNIVNIVQDLGSNVTSNRAEFEAKYGPTVTAIAYGIADAIREISDAVGEVRGYFIAFMQKVTGEASPSFIQMAAKWVVILLAVAAAAGPILLALGGIVSFIMGSVVPALEYVGYVVGAALILPFTTLGQVAGLVFWGMKSEGESTGSVLERMWNTAVQLGTFFMDGIINPMVQMFMNTVRPTIDAVSKKWAQFTQSAHTMWQELFGGVVRSTQALAPLFRAIFMILGKVVGWYVSYVVTAFGWILDAVKPVFSVIKDMSLWILNVFLKGLQKAVSFALKGADALGITKDSPIWVELADFASQKTPDISTGSGQTDNVKAAQGLGKVSAEPPTPTFDPNQIGEKVDPRLAADLAAMNKAALGGKPAVDVNVQVDDQRKLDIKNCMTVDGRELAVAQGRHKQEINERAGFKATPWQRRQIAEQGAAPVGGNGGSQ